METKPLGWDLIHQAAAFSSVLLGYRPTDSKRPEVPIVIADADSSSMNKLDPCPAASGHMGPCFGSPHPAIRQVLLAPPFGVPTDPGYGAKTSEVLVPLLQKTVIRIGRGPSQVW